jgi:hypothetical protein
VSSHTEIDDLHDAVVPDEDVLRGHVAVDEADELAVVAAQLVRRVKPGAHLPGNAEREHERDAARGAALAHEQVERLAVDPLHHLVRHPALLAEIEDLGDVGVADPRYEGPLVEEHLLEIRIVAELRAHELHRDDLPDGPLHARGPHGRHTAEREGHEELIAPERMACADVSYGAHARSDPGFRFAKKALRLNSEPGSPFARP